VLLVFYIPTKKYYLYYVHSLKDGKDIDIAVHLPRAVFGACAFLFVTMQLKNIEEILSWWHLNTHINLAFQVRVNRKTSDSGLLQLV